MAKITEDPRHRQGELLSSWPSSSRLRERRRWEITHGVSCEPLLLSVQAQHEWDPARFAHNLARWTEWWPLLRASLTPAAQGLCIHASTAAVWNPIEARDPRAEILRQGPQWSRLEGPLWQLFVEQSSPWKIWLLADSLLFDPEMMSEALLQLLSLDQGQALPPSPSRYPPHWAERTVGLSDDIPAQGIIPPSPRFCETWTWSPATQEALMAMPSLLAQPKFWPTVTRMVLDLLHDAQAVTLQYETLSDWRSERLMGERRAYQEAEAELTFIQRLAGKPADAKASPISPLNFKLSPWQQPANAQPQIVWHQWFSDSELHVCLQQLPQGRHALAARGISPSFCRQWIALMDETLQQLPQRQQSTLGQFFYPRSVATLWGTWNRTAQAYSLNQTLPQLFDGSLRRHAHRLAIKTGEETLSYAELDSLSRRLAQHFMAIGIGPGDLIGLALPRSPLMLACLLASLRAGAAYVPLDPNFPQDRLRYMLADAQVKLYIADRSLMPLAPAHAHTLAFETLLDCAADYREEDWCEPPQDPRALAYVIYTSGSTGKPKGVMLSHRSVVNFLLSMREEPGMGPDDCILAVTTLSFDIAVLELLLPLLVGASLYLANANEARDGQTLRGILDRERITHFQATPSTYRLILDAGWRGGHLRKALCGGEAFPADVARMLYPLVPEVWNMYGPTETTVWSTLYRLRGDEKLVPIGRPIANTAIYILNEDLLPLLPGQKGEIYIGGGGLALGYLGRPDLTAERFLEVPALGVRVYKTGDIGRYRWDGTIEIFGRADQQIKLRGYRMELGEIEAVTSHIPGIDHCVVVVHNFGPDDDRLVAYVKSQLPWAEKAIRLALKQQLPSYMLPQHIVHLERFPQLPNGKIDRKQLPHPLALLADVSAPPKPEARASDSLAHLSATRREALPLTPSQARMLYVEELDPGTTVHNLTGAWILQGAFDLASFQQALNLLVAEQEALRAVIDRDGELTEMRIVAPFTPDLPLVRIEDASRDLEEVERCILETSSQRLDLARVPHFKMGLYRLGDGRSVFYLLTHHIFWDGFSYGVFWRRLLKLYEQCRQGVEVSTNLDFNFSTYVRERQREVQGPDMAEQLAYWQQRFAQLPEPLELGSDFPRPRDLSHRAETVWIPWDRQLEEALLSLSKQSGCTLYHIVLAAHFALLYRLSAQPDLVIGTPVHGRQQSEVFDLLGNFINVVALRFGVDGSMNFLQMIEQVKRLTYEAQANADVPFEQVIAALKMPRDTSRTPLYNVMVFFQDNSLQKYHLDATPVEAMRLHNQNADTDLVFWIERYAHGTFAGLNFRTDLWDKGSAQAIADTLRYLLDQLLQHPALPLASLPLCSEGHLQIGPLLSKPLQLPAPDLSSCLLQQSLQTPQATALRTLHGESLSFAELEDQTLRLAALLQRRGVGRGDTVGVCLNRRLPLLSTLAAILRLGAAYLPLDPLYPRDRLQYMVGDAGCRLVVTEMEFFDLFPDPALTLLCIDRERATLQAIEPLAQSTPGPGPEDLAYIIYTSGSTGKPKGVEITHHALMHFISAICQRLQLPTKLRTLAITTISFDISILEIFATLALGGTVVLVEHQHSTDGERLMRAIVDERIQLLQATPATWRLLLASGWQGHSQLIALSGGEALTRDLARALVPRVGELWNVYGPTEATVWATAEKIVDPEGPICIGRPLPSYEAYVLDAQKHLMPLGATGHLYLGGPALARGYRFRPDLNAERFIPQPWRPDALMYDTGDLVRRRADGRLEYIARRDNQVKLRGFRIELGEIEACMMSHPAISASVCMVRTDQSDDQRLVAYAVLRREQTLTLSELNRHLAVELPAYMLPNNLVLLPALPLTGSGKVDRKALPAPMATQLPAAPPLLSALPLLSASEEQIAGIFRQLLGVEAVRASDNFFDLGGHSLLALKVMQSCQHDLGLPLKIRDLLLMNVSQIGALLDAARLQASQRKENGR